MFSEQTIRQQAAGRLLEAMTLDRFMLYGQRIAAVGPTRESSDYMEILIRHEEEERKSPPPGGFINVLEGLNLMSLLDRWVINQVVRSLARQHAAQKNRGVPCYSISVSVDTLYENDFCALMREHFHKNQLPPGKLWFEIGEGDAQEHVVVLAKLTSSLRPIGCRLALTSYTGDRFAPASLEVLGVDAVRIEGRLIAGIHNNIEACAKVKAIQGACNKFGIRTIAEMVERPETLETLEKLGVDYAQGSAVGVPVPLRSLGHELH